MKGGRCVEIKLQVDESAQELFIFRRRLTVGSVFSECLELLMADLGFCVPYPPDILGSRI